MYLPDNFDEKKVKPHELSNCEICFTKFDKISNNRHHCRRCGRSVCMKCSLTNRPLSKKDLYGKKVTHRVCDYCDCETQNFKLKKTLEELVIGQQNQIMIFNECVEEVDDQKHHLEAEHKNTKESMQQTLADSVERKIFYER